MYERTTISILLEFSGQRSKQRFQIVYAIVEWLEHIQKDLLIFPNEKTKEKTIEN